MSQSSSWTLLALAASLPATHALTQQVLSSFVFTRYGDRTPLYSSGSGEHVLTPFGAQQMYNAGENFRERYLRSTFDSLAPTTVIQGISRYQLDANQISILTTDDQYTVASAQAFMQGLYPPLGNNPSLNDTYVSGLAYLANGSEIAAPLNGYQYPTISAVSSYDLNSIWVDGSSNCPATTGKLLDYYKTADFDFLNTSSWSFYKAIGEEYLQNSFYPSSLGYAGAYQIYDYLQYEYLHNATFRNTISDVNMTKAQLLAANWVDALYGNASDLVGSVAGRTLANAILTSFSNVINMQGQTNKLNLLFGDYEPMVSFAALAGITDKQNAAFYYIPPMSSSFVVELVALRADDDPGTNFPSTTDLFVEFYYQNGTDEDSRLTAYPLFGASPSQVLLPYSEFASGLAAFTLSGVGAWCDTCGSYDIFCSAYGSGGGSQTGGGKRSSGLSPAVAGVIGALAALAVAALLFGLLMAFAGFRVHRQAGKRKSEIAGFKGSQKLASDQDLTIPKGGAAVSIAEPETAKGHERVGSWELRQQAKSEEAGQMGAVTMNRPRRPSYEDDEIHVDPYATAVKPHDHV